MALPVVLCLLAACSSSPEEDTPVAADDVQVAFTLSLADAVSTRAANEGWDDYDPEDDGTPMENAINPADLQVMICDADGEVLAQVENVRVVKVSEQEESAYEVTGTWKNAKRLLASASKVMVTANCQPDARTDLADLSYELSGDPRRYIPMWGVAPLPRLTLGQRNRLTESVEMLRSMAKVAVELRSDMIQKGYTVSSLSIANYNTAGYCLPLHFREVERTWDVRFDNSLHVLDTPASGTPLSFTTDSPAYLPEYDNTSSQARPASIIVKLDRNGKPDQTYTLYFRHYDSEGAPTGAAYDIQRNHYYHYILYKESDKLIVTLHVRKWNLREYGEDIIL